MFATLNCISNRTLITFTALLISTKLLAMKNNVATLCYYCRNEWLKSIGLFLLMVLSFQAMGQPGKKDTKKVSGIVLSSAEKNPPLANATIKLKGKPTATVADEAGKFSINASTQDTLEVIYVGHQTQYINVGNKQIFNILMLETSSTTNEVIVIGYGTVKKKEFNGVVGKVNMEEAKKAPVTSFDQFLAGRVAGVAVTTNDGQPGSGSNITIRGGTAGQDVSPLFVIDGFPIENMDINSINPNDIESLEILKDASSIAIYGSRGANGVIMITTKKGKAQPMQVSYNVNYGGQNVTKFMDMLSPYEFVKLQLELDSIQSTSTTTVPTGRNRYIDTANGKNLDYYKNVKPYNWQDILIRPGQLQIHNVSVGGGNKDTRFLLSGSYTDQKGIIINTGLKKYDGSFKLSSKLTPKLNLGINLTFSNTNSFGTIPTGGSGGGVIFNAWAFRPVERIGSPSLEDGFIDSTNITASSVVPDNLVNPKQQALNEYRKNITTTTNFNTFLEYQFTNDLKFKISGGLTNTALKSEAFYNSRTSQGTLVLNSSGNPFNLNGINGAVNNTNTINYLTEATLSYRKVYNKNNIIDAVGGFTYQYGQSTGNGFGSIQIPQAMEEFGINSLGLGNGTRISYSNTKNFLYSYLGRVNYSLKERYIFTVSGRVDGSTKFAPGKEWGFFESGAFAWRFSQERFMRRFSKYITDGKLRASFGNVGNNRVNDNASRYTLGFSNAYGYPIFNAASNTFINTIGAVPFFYGNPDITWENTEQLDLGLSLTLFKDKVNIEFDYYNKDTKRSLLAVPLPSIAGYANGTNSQYQNTGVIRNRGIELTITTTNIQKKDFKWTTSFNIAFNRNKIVTFYNGQDLRQTSWNLFQNPTAWVAKVGQPMTQFFGYKWGGVYQYEDFNKLANGTYLLKPGIASYPSTNAAKTIQPGDPKYQDLNGDGVVNDNDRTIIGNPLPIHTGGLSNNFTYKGFSLNIFFQWSYGNDVLNANQLVFNYSGNYYANSNQFASYANRWTPTNPTNDIPRASSSLNGADLDGKTKVSSRLVEDGSFVRLKTVSLSYMIPQKFTQKMHINNISVFVAAQNLLTWTKYSGQDPEVSTYRGANPANVPSGVTGGNALGGVGYLYIQPSSGSAALAQGLDFTAYPRNKTYTVGAKVIF